MSPEDWQALREWLIQTRADAERFAKANRFDLAIGSAFAAQVEVLSCALGFMDERERQALR